MHSFAAWLWLDCAQYVEKLCLSYGVCAQRFGGLVWGVEKPRPYPQVMRSFWAVFTFFALRTMCTNLFRSFYTRKFSVYSLLVSTFTHNPQGLLLKLLLINQ